MEKTGKTVRTTVALPEELLGAMDRVVSEGWAKSRNEFLGIALRHELTGLERARIDDAFGDMAEDDEYRAEAEDLAREFEGASREALEEAERDEGAGQASR